MSDSDENIFFRKKISKCFYGHIECTFDNPAGKFSTKARKIFAQNPKKSEEKKFREIISFQNLPIVK